MSIEELFKELVYGGKDIEKLILDKYPKAVIEDASDDVHEERFNVEIPDVCLSDFYIFAIREEFVSLCFKFQLMLHNKREIIEQLMELADLNEKIDFEREETKRLNKETKRLAQQ